MYFKGVAVYFDLSFLVGKVFSVIIWTSRRKKHRLWFFDIMEARRLISSSLSLALLSGKESSSCP